MLDEFHSDRPEDYVRGFPDHPHRGFETVTYMLEGAMEHKDSLGNQGRLGPGSAQWMTAGHGIVHSEMPKQERGLMWGFQLWINLPAARKMTRPRYQDLAPDRIPEVAAGEGKGAIVRVVAGEVAGARGPVEGIVTAPVMLDVRLPPGGRFTHVLPTTHAVFAYVFDGAVRLAPRHAPTSAGELAVFGPGEALEASSETGGRALVFAAAPIGEPVARRGPFVMNTEAELDRAFEDYRSGRLVLGG
jgi:redox-sensitive bicupin YhaK (pirin superfamily)